MTRTVLAAALAFLMLRAAAAQTIQIVDDAKLPRFEVVSIKPSDPRDTSGMIGIPQGRFVQENVDMYSAINIAFGIKPFQMPSPLPDVLKQHYSIDARMPAGAPPTDRALMMRAMFVDRFKMRYHIDPRSEDGYALVVARPDRKLGPNLRASAVDCTTRTPAERRKEDVPPLPAGAKPCGIDNNRGVLDLGGVPFSTLVAMLSNQTGKTVVDKTGLTGNFDVELHWSATSSGPLRTAGDNADGGPSIFTAVQEQLGLKLEPVRTPVDHLVIDHVERPEPD